MAGRFTLQTLLGVLVTLAPWATLTFAQSCQCGYRDSNGNVWREAIISTFTQPEGALAAVQDSWMISTYSNPQQAPATANIQYDSANVMQHNDALGLKASAYDNSGFVRSAEIVTQRSDFLHGTFRIRAQIPSAPGAVFGFFTYFSNTQEQDIEFLSAEPNYFQRVHYTNHPGQDAGATLDTVIPGADFTTFGNHRIDWLPSPSRTLYSYDGSGLTSTKTLTVNVPTSPSRLILNVWSNGDPGWSQGPPTSDAIATVQWAHLYFNSTSLGEGAFNSACVAAGRPAPCNI